MAATVRGLLAAAGVVLCGCGTFGDDFDDVVPEESGGPTGPTDKEADGADAGLDAGEEPGLVFGASPGHPRQRTRPTTLTRVEYQLITAPPPVAWHSSCAICV
jgi:hypothetical protein